MSKKPHGGITMEYEHEALGKAAAKMEKTIDAINRQILKYSIR